MNCGYYEEFPIERVKEGKVTIIVPKLEAFVKSPSEYAPSKAPVFYNPVMELNRDMSVLALQAYQRIVDHELCMCDPLGGSGAMGIRFAAEVEDVKTVVISDISRRAAELTIQNVKVNNLSDRVSVQNQDANELLSCHGAPRRRFDAVNIDPFGSPVPYMDSAIRALRNNGLLALTATDMAPLCGVHSRACVRKYGGKPLRTEYCHELAIRLLAGCLALTAAKYDVGTKIMFSHCSDHYVRVYAILHHGAKKADASVEDMGYIQHCFNCLHRETIKTMFPSERPNNCVECHAKLSYAGPLWLGPICDEGFSKIMEEELGCRAFKNEKNIRTILKLAKEESKAPPTYYVVDKLSSKLGLPVPPVKIVVQELRDDGFVASLTHFHTRGIKSDASAESVKRILREIVSRNR